MKTIEKTSKLVALVLAVAFLFTACNKTKKIANRLDDGEWKITELSVDGTNENELPTWKIVDCDGYKKSCTGEWKNDEGGNANFVWQFREKGKVFEISNQSDLHGDHAGEEHAGEEHAQEEAVLQCQNFSGIYEVLEHKRKTMKFKSTKTVGFSEKTVLITIEKK